MNGQFWMAMGLGLLASPVWAQSACPTSADLVRGIRIDFSDGSSEIYRSRDDRVVAVKGLNADGAGYEMELAQGLYLLNYRNTENGAPLTDTEVFYDYGVSFTTLPEPAPGKRWQSDVTVTSVDGIRSEDQVHAYDALGTDVIGACTYDLISVLIAYESDDAFVENVHYLPELGFGYLVWNETSDKPRIPVPAVSITVLSK